MEKLTLTLKNGTSITGNAFGAIKESEGEVVFTTGMVGYPESLTDPSFKDQILVLTYPLVGNYGVPSEELDEYKISKFFESTRIHLKGLIVTDYSETYSHWNAGKSLSDWLREYDVPGISGVDTRALTELLRDGGSQLGKIHGVDKKPDDDFYDPNKENLVAKVSTPKPEIYGEGKKHIAIIDTGMKLNILRSFLHRGIRVTRFPWNVSPFNEGYGPFDGVFFSNGPGDPELMVETVAIMKECFERKIPTFGICLGHQIMGIAGGAKTYKLKYGHRSQNQPCIDTRTGRCYITSQNHGFAIDAKTIKDDWEISFLNANDQTVEGLRHKHLPFFSVQFHPEANPGPVDTAFLFDEFVDML
ncbi:MAG: glutamine-hydrolyzing carbamoyl-phosphate synthase small subunit [Candidatus Gracilibacteria bacterium]